jgi:hypothetical protein
MLPLASWNRNNITSAAMQNDLAILSLSRKDGNRVASRRLAAPAKASPGRTGATREEIAPD